MLQTNFELGNGLRANPKGASYRTIRRDAEATLPQVSMDLVRIGPDGMAVEETDVSSMKQTKGLRKHMETATCTVHIERPAVIIWNLMMIFPIL